MDGNGQFNFFGNGGPVSLTLVEEMPNGAIQKRQVNLVLTPAQVNTPAEIETYLGGYSNWDYRGEEVSKPVLVTKDSDYYRDFSSNNAFKRTHVKNSLNGALQEITLESSTTQYQVVDRMIGAFIPDVTEENAQKLYNVRMRSAALCKNAIMLDRNIDVWTMLTTSGNWNAANVASLGASAAWGTSSGPGASSDPIKDLRNRIVKSAQRVTDIWMNQQVALVFLEHASVREHVRSMLGDAGLRSMQGTTDIVNNNAATDFQIPGLPPIHVESSKVLNETTNELDFILNHSTVLVTTPPGIPQDGMEIATTHTFRRRGRSGTGFQVREFREEKRGVGGTFVVVNMADHAVMPGPNCGGLITGCFQ